MTYRLLGILSRVFQLNVVNAVTSSDRERRRQLRWHGRAIERVESRIHFSAYTVVDLGTLGGASSEATAINSGGEVVGTSRTLSATHAFLYNDGTMKDLGTFPGGVDSEATAIDDQGDVVGGSDTSTSGHDPFYYTDGAMRDLGSLEPDTTAIGINNSYGQIVTIPGSDVSEGHEEGTPFLYSGGRIDPVLNTDPNSGLELQTAYGIDDFGEICGDGVVGINEHALLWTGPFNGGTIQDLGVLPGGHNSKALGVNAFGQVVGDADTGSGDSHAFLYSNFLMQDLGTITVILILVLRELMEVGRSSEKRTTMGAGIRTPSFIVTAP